MWSSVVVNDGFQIQVMVALEAVVLSLMIVVPAVDGESVFVGACSIGGCRGLPWGWAQVSSLIIDCSLGSCSRDGVALDVLPLLYYGWRCSGYHGIIQLRYGKGSDSR